MHMPLSRGRSSRARPARETGQTACSNSTPTSGQPDLLGELGLADNTLVVFAGDNCPEEVLLWRGIPGYWEGSYFAGGEGNLRTPCIVRWPERVPGGRVSDEIMHVTDWFTTLLYAAGAEVPADRVIDGVDQLAWLSGDQQSSLREGYIFWIGL